MEAADILAQAVDFAQLVTAASRPGRLGDHAPQPIDSARRAYLTSALPQTATPECTVVISLRRYATGVGVVSAHAVSSPLAPVAASQRGTKAALTGNSTATP